MICKETGYRYRCGVSECLDSLSYCYSVLWLPLGLQCKGRAACRLRPGGGSVKRRYKRFLPIRPIRSPRPGAPTLVPFRHSIQAFAGISQAPASLVASSQSVSAPAAMIDPIFSDPQSPTRTLSLYASQRAFLSSSEIICLTNKGTCCKTAVSAILPRSRSQTFSAPNSLCLNCHLRRLARAC